MAKDAEIYIVDISKRTSTINDMYARLGQIADGLATDWFNRQSENMFEEFHLYIIKADENNGGQLAVASDGGELSEDDRWELARAVRLSPAWTIEQASQNMYQWLRQMPILAP